MGKKFPDRAFKVAAWYFIAAGIWAIASVRTVAQASSSPTPMKRRSRAGRRIHRLP